MRAGDVVVPGHAVHAATTSVRQGTRITFRRTGSVGAVPVVVSNVGTGEIVLATRVDGPVWILDVPHDWPSGLYAARFCDRPADDHDREVNFAVRAAWPGRDSRVLVAAPFLTWQAYNRLGVPGEGLYLTEQPDRAARVSFDRPGGGARAAGDWEAPFYRWLAATGHQADYCSNIDLHTGDACLDRYDLLVVAGHDEYWTWQMRDAVESFVAAGGNLAVFSGNTCWWQARLEDDGRTLVCYRDSTHDPVAAVDPARTTVEWGSAPVCRPENSLTGVSFRHGAGCWEDVGLMDSAAYTVRFAEHWVFAGTGLRDGDAFAAGAVGYETDAADHEEVDGVPRATGRDGAPPSLTILATADLRHWRRAGQGGHATMVVFRAGQGTVFNAATVNWANRLDDPVVARITDNVLRRLSSRQPATGWVDIGDAADIVAMAAVEHLLFGSTAQGRLLVRDVCAQNLRWRPVDTGPPMVALAAPRESVARRGVGLYGLDHAGRISVREPVPEPAPWRPLCEAPVGTVDLAVCYDGIFALTADALLWRLPLDQADDPRSWQPAGGAPGAHAMTAVNGLLFVACADGTLHTRRPASGPSRWTAAGTAAGARPLAGYAGRLIAAGADGRLRWAVPRAEPPRPVVVPAQRRDVKAIP